MTDDFDRDPTAAAVRASLARNAQDAPPAGLLAERIIHTASAAPARSRRFRNGRTWLLPLVAAGAVGAVVVAVVGIENYHPDAHQAPPAGSGRASTSASATTSSASTAASVATRPVVVPTGPTGQTALRSVQIVDLTFAHTDVGWALASADCLHGSGRCTALLHTTDGRTWRDIPGAQFNVPGVGNCAAPCVEHLRFATDKIGYAYGLHALFMTTDGGASWTQDHGGAILLESFDQNVIRVTSTGSGCPGPCDVRVETASIGSTRWTAADLGPLSSAGLALSRGGTDAYLLVMRNPAGGAQDATSTLYRSTDDGRHWQAAGEPCPQSSTEVDSVAVAAGGGDRVSVLCVERAAPRRSFVATSTDAGAHFAAQPGTVPAPTATLLTGDPQTVLVTAGTGLARSTDGGARWQPVPTVTGDVSFIGFESPTVGRAVADGGRAIWTTRDAGATWSVVSFQ